MTRVRPTALWIVAGVSALAAAVVWVWPVASPPAAIRPDMRPPAELPTFAGLPPDVLERFVEHNAFDLSRRPPAERELLAVADTFPEPMAVGEGDTVASPVDAGFAVEPVPALFGIVDTPDGRRALLRLDPEKARAALFAPGDGTAGWRVVLIGPESVTLDGPSGRQVVTLSPRPRTP